MISLKGGIKLLGLKPEMIVGHMAVCLAYSEAGHDVVITSGTEGKHSRNSRHYSGLAMDYRSRHVSEGAMNDITSKVKKALEGQFDVVLESDHLHVEFDPKP